jgi:hypothetical protein
MRFVAAQIAERVCFTRYSMVRYPQRYEAVKEKHFDPTHGGLNWNEIKDCHHPRIAVAECDQGIHLSSGPSALLGPDGAAGNQSVQAGTGVD